MEWLYQMLFHHFSVSGVETYLFIPPLVMFIASSITSTGGISGAFLLLPFQVSILNYTSPGASATNFIYNIIAIPGGVYRYMRDGKFSWTLFLSLMIGTLPGVFFGYYVRLVYLVDPKRFKFFVGCVLIYLGLRTIWSGFNEFKHPSSKTMAKGRIEKEHLGIRSKVIFNGNKYDFSTLGVIIPALFVGIIGGAYGIGGGALMAPYLISILNLPVYIISGAALCSTWVTSILGILIYTFGPLSTKAAQACPDWFLGALFGIGGLLGTYFGAWLQKYLTSSWIKLILGTIICYIALRYIWPMLSTII